MLRARFDVLVNIPTASDGPLYLRDLSASRGSMTITNDAEAVVKHCAASGMLGRAKDRRILYYDSEGDLDELVHDRGVFLGFKSAREG